MWLILTCYWSVSWFRLEVSCGVVIGKTFKISTSFFWFWCLKNIHDFGIDYEFRSFMICFDFRKKKFLWFCHLLRIWIFHEYIVDFVIEEFYDFNIDLRIEGFYEFDDDLSFDMIGNSFKLWFGIFEKFCKRFLENFLSNEVEMVLFTKYRISSLLVLLFIYKRAMRMGYHPSLMLTQLLADTYPIWDSVLLPRL